MKTNYKLIKLSDLGGKPCITNLIEPSVQTIKVENFNRSEYKSVHHEIHKK